MLKTQLQENASETKIKEEPNIDLGPDIQDPFNDVAIPAIDHPPTMEFSVTIKVEECDEMVSKELPDDNNEAKANENISKDNDTKTDSCPTTSVKQVKPSNFTVTSGEVEAEKSNSNKFKEYVINTPMMLKIAEQILELNQVPDTFLAIGVRNYAGRILYETVRDARDIVLNNALEDWQMWHLEHSAVRDAPLIYKCYICGKSWWYYHDFREHINQHTKLKCFVTVSLESNMDECSLICYQLGVIFNDVVLPKSCCDRCGKSAESHTFVNNDPYKCMGCKTTFSMCTQLTLHENQCPQYRKLFFLDGANEHKCSICIFECTNESELYNHMIRKHSVRSDMVTSWDVKKCNVCSKSYVLKALHICLRKTNNYGCSYCGRSFQKKVYKEIHMANYGNPTQCRICNKQLIAQCMESSHMLQHTDRYALMYKCVQCIEGRYYPDEFSIIHHTKIVHNRPFEKKFKYLEMVILPKQCLEKSSEPLQVRNSDSTKPASKDDIANSKVFFPSTRYRSTLKQQMPVDVGVKQEPMSNDLDIDTLCVSDLSSIQTEAVDESNPHIQILDITSLQDFIKFETEPVESDTSETIETSDDDSETDFSIDPVGVKRKKTTRIIPRFTELLVFGNRLGVDLKRCDAPPSFAGKWGTQLKQPALVQNKLVPPAVKQQENRNGLEEQKHKVTSKNVVLQKSNTTAKKQRIEKPKKTIKKQMSNNQSSMKCNDKTQSKPIIGNNLDTTIDEISQTMKSVSNVKLNNNLASVKDSSLCKAPNTIELGNDIGINKNDLTSFEDSAISKTVETVHPVNEIQLNNNVSSVKDFAVDKSSETAKSAKAFKVNSINLTSLKTLAVHKNSKTVQSANGPKLNNNNVVIPNSEINKVHENIANNILYCEICPFETNSKNQLNSHLRAHAASKSFNCDKCYYKTVDLRGLKHHHRIHAGAKPYSCSVCSKAFSRQRYLKQHLRIHTGEKPYSCTVCSKAFTQQSHLIQHFRIHTGEKPYSCTACSKAFIQQSDLKQHILRMHTGEKPFSCTTCSKAFIQQSDLKQHILRMHTGEKPFSCTTCSKAFIQQSDLKQHILRMHTGEKPFSCTTCSKAFAHQSSLLQHLRIHTGEKPYSCTTCSKTFTQKGDLKKHLRIHTGEKPYSCTACSKVFTRQSNLKLHLRIHTGEKPYSCTVCSKAFSRQKYLKGHLRVHTGEKPYVCDICKKGFLWKKSLRTHLSLHC